MQEDEQNLRKQTGDKPEAPAETAGAGGITENQQEATDNAAPGVYINPVEPEPAASTGYARLKKPSTPAAKVAEGAILVALATVLALISMLVPFLNFVWPIPIILLIYKHGFAIGCLGLAVTAALLSLLFGPTSILLVVGMSGVALWFGFALRKGLGAGKTLFVGIFVSGFFTVLTLLLSSGAMGLAVHDLIAQVDESSKMAVQVLKQSGMLQQLPDGMTIEQYTDYVTGMMRTLIPAVLIMMAMAEALITYALTGVIFRRLGYQTNRLPKFTEWHLPWMSLWGLIIALAAYVGNQALGLEWMKALAFNILYLYAPILIITGLAMVWWYAKRTGLGFLRWVIIIGMVLMIPFIYYFVLMIGLTDAVADFRKLIKTAEENRKKMGLPR